MNPNTRHNPFKPYQLVLVKQPSKFAEQGSYSYVGQLMSYPVPGKLPENDSTIMVRRVPNHPGTLEEHPLTNITAYDPSRGKARHISYVACRGFGQFPVDMLRYDHCAPLNFKIVEEFSGPKAVVDPAFDFLFPVVAKVLSRSYAAFNWTSARWESFLWRIEELKVESFEEGR